MTDYPTEEQWAELVKHFGCSTCNTISLYGEHICKHGVNVCEPVTISFTLTTTTDVCHKWLRGVK